jgi:hypothetical protein
MKPPTTKNVPIRKLRQQLLARQFAVPKLQRNFVWDPRRAAKLLDSIYRGMPIGSLFLWDMDRKSANLIRQQGEVLPPFSSKNKQISFVIDGQQRLSVIYQAFEAQRRFNDAGREIDFSRLCFVVTPDPESDSPDRVVYRKALGTQFVPIRDILAPVSEWKRRMPSQAKWFLRRIHECRRRLLSYPLPVVTVESATLDEIGEVFIRLNRQGMRITAADRAIALMGKLDVRQMAVELRQKVRDEIFALSSVDPILMGFNLVSEPLELDGDPPKLEAMARRWSKRIKDDEDEKKVFRKEWHKYQDAFRKAVDYLHRNFPVYDESYLPSANMLATLSVFFFHHPAPPSGHQRLQFRRWFWATGVAQRYSGRGYHRNIVADAKLFASLANGANRRFNFSDRLDPVPDIQSVEYASHSARTRAFFCLLASRKPRYLENGEPIALDHGAISYFNKKHRHHIFPRAQLRNHFTSRTYNSLCNICFLVAWDDGRIGMKLPRAYLAQYWRNGRQHFRQVMKSHLIPIGDDSGIWERGVVGAFWQFRQARLKLICTEFEKVAGIKLFRKS